MGNLLAPEDRLQRELDLSAPETDSQAPMLLWKGCYFQHVIGERVAIGVHNVREFVGEFGEPATHERARQLIDERLNPRHPDHNALMDAMREADERHALDMAESRAEDAALERLWGWER
jgi:hypothetical protein